MPEISSPADGHRFRFSFTSAGSYGVTSEEGYTDSDDWSAPRSVTVRAWSLREALGRASDLPLAAWFDEETDHPRPGQIEPGQETPPRWKLLIADGDGTVVAGFDTDDTYHAWEDPETVVRALCEIIGTITRQEATRG